MSAVRLRDVTEADVPLFFEHQRGFVAVGRDVGFAEGRGERVEELVLRPDPGPAS